ncbi:hypothetical protein ACFPRL_11070 [Pseudoclavibacter helvolus]
MRAIGEKPPGTPSMGWRMSFTQFQKSSIQMSSQVGEACVYSLFESSLRSSSRAGSSSISSGGSGEPAHGPRSISARIRARPSAPAAVPAGRRSVRP